MTSFSSTHIGFGIVTVLLIILTSWYFYLCVHELETNSKQLWYQKRGIIIVRTHVISLILCLTLTNALELHDPKTGILHPIYHQNHGYGLYYLLCLLWFLSATLSTSLILGRILLQLFNNIRAQVSDHRNLWTKYIIIRYFYIFGNEKIILLFSFISWLLFCGYVFIVIFSENGKLFDWLDRFVHIIIWTLCFYFIKTCIIGYLCKLLYNIKDLKLPSEMNNGESNTNSREVSPAPPMTPDDTMMTPDIVSTPDTCTMTASNNHETVISISPAMISSTSGGAGAGAGGGGSSVTVTASSNDCDDDTMASPSSTTTTTAAIDMNEENTNTAISLALKIDSTMKIKNDRKLKVPSYQKNENENVCKHKSMMENFDSWYFWSEIKWVLITLNIGMIGIALSMLIEYIITLKIVNTMRITYLFGYAWSMTALYLQTFYVNNKNQEKELIFERIINYCCKRESNGKNEVTTIATTDEYHNHDTMPEYTRERTIGSLSSDTNEIMVMDRDNGNNNTIDIGGSNSKTEISNNNNNNNNNSRGNNHNSSNIKHRRNNNSNEAKKLKLSVTNVICRKNEYNIFMSHLKKELSMENLLFLTAILQWQSYLVKHHFWDKNNVKCKYILNSKKQIKLPKSVPNCLAIKQLKKQNHDKNDKNLNFDIFIPVFNQIYKEFIERNRAPFEINISHSSRGTMEKHFKNIVKEDASVNENIFIENNKNGENGENGIANEGISFWDVWDDFRFICNELNEPLFASLQRCKPIVNSNHFRRV